MGNSTQEPLANNNEQVENNLYQKPDNGDKNAKLKWAGVGVLSTLILVVVVVFVWFQSQGRQNKDINQINNQQNQTQNVTSTPTVFSIDSNAWELSLAKDEIKASSGLIENNLIYAVKNEYTTIVYRRNVQGGTQTKILEFDENRKADKSGNLWSGLPPSISLSQDGKLLAFADKEGLKVYDLQTKYTKTYIRKASEGECEECAPKWSIDLGGTYTLARPLWSYDGKYISFLQSHYEGSSFGVIDTASGAYTALKNIYGGYSNLNWSLAGHAYVKASSGGYEGIGLYVSIKNNIAEANNLALKLGKTEDTPFLEANFSPNGNKIVFTFEEPYETKNLAITNTDGTGFTVLAEKTDARMPFFSSDGNSVLYFQQKNNKQILVRHDIISKSSSDLIILPVEFNRWDNAYWTKDGFLALVGISSSSGLTLGGDSTRMVILDVANKKVIYASPVFDQFTNFAGLSN